MQDDQVIFALSQKINDCIAEIEAVASKICSDDRLGEQRLENLNHELADAVTRLVGMPPEAGGSAAWTAGILAMRAYVVETREGWDLRERVLSAALDRLDNVITTV